MTGASAQVADGERMLGSAEIRELVPMSDAVDAVREAFLALAGGAFTLPPRLALADGTLLVMAAHHGPSGTGTVKTVSVELDRTPAILGALVWTSRQGRLVADATAITTLRTGAVVGVATDALADPAATALTLIGAGAQAADQVRAVHAVRPLRTLTVVNRHRERASALLDELAGELPGVTLRATDDVEAGLAAAEIVCCATSSTLPLFALEALPERVHVNAVGSFRTSMRELPAELLATAQMVVVDQREAAVEESGEIAHALEHGAIGVEDLRELGSVVREGAATTGRTVFKSVGIAVQDWAIARLLSRPMLR